VEQVNDETELERWVREDQQGGSDEPAQDEYGALVA
jgi:hypothetical protein